MNFLADECCDALVVAGLRGDGHDVLYVREVAPGSGDLIVLQTAADQNRILLTEDKDFGELVVRFQLPTYGILLLRINPADGPAKLDRLRDVIAKEGQRLAGSFTVVDLSKARIRPLT